MELDSQKCVDQHAITIWEVKKDRLTALQHKLTQTPKLLTVTAAGSKCSIFKVPQVLTDVNGPSYQPHIVSIGPFHHGEPQLQLIEEHKGRILSQLLNRNKAIGIVLEDLLKAVQPLQVMARECYSETVPYSTDEFIEMMVLDSCFIIEILRMFGGLVDTDESDPLVKTSWVVSFLLCDLIRMENQIPFFVLECLFELTKMPTESPTLAMLALGFYGYAQKPKNVYFNKKSKHLLDLLRSTFISQEIEKPTKPENHHLPLHIIHNATQLHRMGFKLQRPQEAEIGFLLVNYSNKDTIDMPTIQIDDFMSVLMLNAIAYEQCHTGSSKHFTTYAILLSCLIRVSGDMEYLCDQNIIVNQLGTNDELETFLNNMVKHVTLDVNECYLAPLFHNVNKRCVYSWQVQLAIIKNTYFITRWSIMSSFAAFVLLLLTIAQTIYAILSYARTV
uniref:UPF0481 protein At3g47200-like n=1 Tax=Erigeron canadensis TaxID=72917 RepID=UPI001CB93850|nr:UPF0481 protein At3g47200-like [Erigeron canadensis]